MELIETKLCDRCGKLREAHKVVDIFGVNICWKCAEEMGGR